MSTLEALANVPGKWGLLAKYDDPIIRFLMDRKFPWLKRISNAPRPAPTGRASRRGASFASQKSEEIVGGGTLTPTATESVAKYEAQLLALTHEGRRQLFEQEGAKCAEERRGAAEIERQLQEKTLYAQWRAADFSHWLRAALWNADEANDLSLGKEPDTRFGWNYISRLLQMSEFARTYEKRRLLIYRAIQAGDLPNPMRPEHFMRWAATLQLVVPDELKISMTPPEDRAPKEVNLASSAQGCHQSLIQRKPFIDQYAGRIRNGKVRLKQFFDGKTHKQGELPEAAQFRVPGKPGCYDLEAMLEYFRKRGDYSEIGW